MTSPASENPVIGTGKTPDAARPVSWADRRAEILRRRRRKRILTWAPWLVLSLIVHLCLLAWLAGFRFGIVRPSPPPEIVLDTDIVETFRTVPVTYRTVLTDEGDAASGGAEGGTLKPLAGPSAPPPILDVEKLSLAALGRDLLARKESPAGPGPDANWLTTPDLTHRVVTGGGRDAKSVLDELALVIAESARKRSTCAVILFDESQSLLDTRALVGKQLERTFADLKFEITDKDETRLKWALVSFGEEAKVCLRPTREIAKVKAALAQMPVDTTGTENTVRAIRFCVQQFARSAERLILILVSDEEGDDTGMPENRWRTQTQPLRETVDLCRKNQTQIYVLGSEAMLEHPVIRVTVKGLQNQTGDLTRGLSTYLPELPPRLDGLRMIQGYIPSGFGCYSLSLLADKTGGRFFILSQEPTRYDEKALQNYEPEWCFPNEYEARINNSPVRKEIAEIARLIASEAGVPVGELCEETWSQQKSSFEQLARSVEARMRWCDDRIDRLLNARNDLNREKGARKRWEANYDLTLALLYKAKAMLAEYRAKARDTARLNEFPIQGPTSRSDEKRIAYFISEDRGGRFGGGRDEENVRQRAIKALEGVIRAHAGTPWAACAQSEIASLAPIRFNFTIVDTAGGGAAPPTMPNL